MRADEFMRMLEQDEEYMARRAKEDKEMAAKVAELRAAEAPLVNELIQAGYAVDSAWDLVNTSEPYPDALPILVKHLQRGGYPPRVMEGIGRALAVKPAVQYWDELKELWRRAEDRDELEGLAVALSACAGRDQLDDLVGMLTDLHGGEQRAYLIGSVVKLGGDYGLDVVRGLLDDPFLSLYAKNELDDHRRKEERRARRRAKAAENRNKSAN